MGRIKLYLRKTLLGTLSISSLGGELLDTRNQIPCKMRFSPFRKISALERWPFSPTNLDFARLKRQSRLILLSLKKRSITNTSRLSNKNVRSKNLYEINQYLEDVFFMSKLNRETQVKLS